TTGDGVVAGSASGGAAGGERDQIVAVAAIDAVLPAGVGDRVVAFTTRQRIAGKTADQAVVAIAAVEVEAGRARGRQTGGRNGVVAIFTKGLPDKSAARERDRVVAEVPVHECRAIASDADGVIALAAEDRVGASA